MLDLNVCDKEVYRFVKMDLTVAHLVPFASHPFYPVTPYLRSPLLYPDPAEYLSSYYKFYDGKIIYYVCNIILYPTLGSLELIKIPILLFFYNCWIPYLQEM